MARVCEVCKKEYMKANHVAKGIGQRVSRRTTRAQKPNLRIKRLEIGDQKIKVRLCASCLKRIKFERVNAEKKAAESTPVSE